MPSYLIHFNKNHDKLGQFTFGDGDGDGIRDDHSNQKTYLKNRWGIRKGYQNKDGTLTSKGEKALNTNQEYKNLSDKYNKEYKKLRKNKNLKEADDVDNKTFEKMAKEEGLNTKSFHESYTKMEEYHKKNEKYIIDGYNMTRRMLDTNPDFSKMTAKELFNMSEHASDVGSVFVSFLMDAFIGPSIYTPLTIAGIVESIGSGVELSKYEAERRRQNKE